VSWLSSLLPVCFGSVAFISKRKRKIGLCTVGARVETGAVFGKWTVLEHNPHKRHGKVLCRCACGREKKVFVSNLRSGLSRSCGRCNRIEPGLVQGKLTVLGYPWTDSNNRSRVKCRCECGKIYYPRTDDLVHGKIQSCRCAFFTPEYRLKMREKALKACSPQSQDTEST